MAQRLVFFGNERLATGVTTEAWAFVQLLTKGYEIAAVVVAQNDTGKSRRTTTTEIVEKAKAHNIPVFAPNTLNEIQDELIALEAEAGILAAYGKLVPQSIIDIFPRGIINIHPSLLPKHRGSIPIESTILAGEATGVSLMQLVAKMDAGPVCAQTLPADYHGMSKQAAADGLDLEATQLLLKHLPAILDGSLQPIQQDESLATYDKRIQKDDGIIDWNKPAEQIEREVRAYAGWPRSKTQLAGRDVIITTAKALGNVGVPGTADTIDGQLVVFCKWGALQIDSLIPAGKKEMTGQAFMAGYPVLDAN